VEDKKKQALIKTLNHSRNFDSNLSKTNRRWFLEKLIKTLEADGLSDNAIELTTKDIVPKAKTLVKANRNFALALKADGNSRFTSRALRHLRSNRVEILYGAIAFNRQFVEAQNLNYLLFIAKRRFRQICRMFFWVNPNYQGYMRYPHTCTSDPHYRVNEDAQSFWEKLNPPNYLPIKMTKQSGTLDPAASLGKMFIKKKDACKGNLLDCSATASLIFMDGLFEAKTPAQLLNKMASKGDNYLVIHQLGFGGNNAYERDTTETGVTQVVGIPAPDLQVGDHVYIYNHPLYKTFRPTGSWRGEHGLVYSSGNRDYKSKDGFVFGGHGKEGTLYQFYDAFLSELKTHLAIARQLMVAHLAFMAGGASAILPGTVTEEEHNIVINNAAATSYRLLQYDKNVEAKDYTKVPTRSKRKPKSAAPAFVVTQSKTENVFYLDQVSKPNEDAPLDKNLKKKITEITTTGALSHPIKFQRITAPSSGASPSEIYDKANWGVVYFDKSTNTDKIWAFFELKAGKLQRKELTHDDLFQSPFQLFTKKGANLRTTQPKVDFRPGHQNFLTANGAF